jgi:hypothetical protein
VPTARISHAALQEPSTRSRMSPGMEWPLVCYNAICESLQLEGMAWRLPIRLKSPVLGAASVPTARISHAALREPIVFLHMHCRFVSICTASSNYSMRVLPSSSRSTRTHVEKKNNIHYI